jgi:hypothetical protein
MDIVCRHVIYKSVCRWRQLNLFESVDSVLSCEEMSKRFRLYGGFFLDGITLGAKRRSLKDFASGDRRFGFFMTVRC